MGCPFSYGVFAYPSQERVFKIRSPLAGAAIGYFTNYIAIKMLFRPYEEKRIFGIKLPFTPGVIPKEKERIAKSLGEAIGSELLNENVIISSMAKDDLTEKIQSISKKYIIHKKLIILNL